MKIFSTLRSALPLVAIVTVMLLASCASSNKKYGCPNKLHAVNIR